MTGKTPAGMPDAELRGPVSLLVIFELSFIGLL